MTHKNIVVGSVGLLCITGGYVACTIYEQEVSLNVCDVRQPPPDTECMLAYTQSVRPLGAVGVFPPQLVVTNETCVADPTTGVPVGDRALYIVQSKVSPSTFSLPNLHVFNAGRALCAKEDRNGTVTPILRDLLAAARSGPVVQLDAYQGHDEQKVVRAKFSAEFPYRDPLTPLPTQGEPPSYPAGALNWVLQMYDLNAQRWVDLKSVSSPPLNSSWSTVPISGELSANVPGNTEVRLELRSTVNVLLQIRSASISAPICVRDAVSGRCR